jgi:OHCU decarboxylase
VTLAWLNSLGGDDARAELLRCCGSRRWAETMAKKRPFASETALMIEADDAWWKLAPDDWLEAFAAHPRIGNRGDVQRQEAKAQSWAAHEQAGTSAAATSTLDALAAANADYEKRFGHIYIVCATGKSAEEMLGLCRARLENAPADELRVAADEQRKITRIRLDRLLRAAPQEPPR